MMMLLAEEVVELTGKKAHAAQHRMLEAMGIPYLPRPDMHPAVLRIHVEHLLGGHKAATASAATIKRRPQLHE